jgi:hypothetical protein
VSRVANVTTVAAGNFHTCAVLPGAVECWGDNPDGELGNATFRQSSVPVAVVGLGTSAPVFGKTANVDVVSGVVRVRLPGSNAFVPLSSAVTIPVGSTVDTTNGEVKLAAARDPGGRVQTGLFSSGEFRVTQTMARSPLSGGKVVGATVLTLAGPLPTCGSGGRTARAMSSRKRRKLRRVVADTPRGSGFHTGGTTATASDIGTKWLTEDTCAGTLVRVIRGVVVVDDLVLKRTVVVRAPHSYLARKARGGQTIHGFAVSVEDLLGRLAGGRGRLKTTLAGVLSCSLSARAARVRVQAVLANRTAIRGALDDLRPPTAPAATVSARLRTAIDHSIASDRHYRDWLTEIGQTPSCPPRRTAAFVAAGRQDSQATAAKQRFVAVFDSLARQQHLHTWRANAF